MNLIQKFIVDVGDEVHKNEHGIMNDAPIEQLDTINIHENVSAAETELAVSSIAEEKVPEHDDSAGSEWDLLDWLGKLYLTRGILIF